MAAPSESSSTDAIRFYFSFRSPYAWLAAEQLESQLGDLGVPVERIPIFPTPETFPNDPVSLDAKVAYLVQDVRRLTRERGLTLRFPPVADPDWRPCHAAFLGVRDDEGAHRFMLEVFRKRFSEGQDLGDEAVLADAAARAQLDPERIRAAARSGALREEASAGFRLGIERDGIFGVPSFVFAGKLYWGQDRMHFLRAAVIRKTGASGPARPGVV